MFSAIGPVMDGQAFKMRNFSVGESTAVQMLLSHIAPQFATSSKKKKNTNPAEVAEACILFLVKHFDELRADRNHKIDFIYSRALWCLSVVLISLSFSL